MKWIGWPLPEIWPFEIFKIERSVVGRSLVAGRWSVGRQYNYFLHWSHILLFATLSKLTCLQLSVRFSLSLLYKQKACFQLVMVSDYRTGRSYVMFNYNKFDQWYWWYSAQGYRVQTSYKRLYTSYSYLSSELPTLIGNTGKLRAVTMHFVVVVTTHKCKKNLTV